MLHAKVAATGEAAFAAEGPRGPPAVMKGVAAVQKLIAIAGHGAAFAGRKVLGVLETEAPQVAQRAALAATVLGQPCLASVFNHSKVVFLGDRVDRVHVAGHAVDVDRQNGAGAVGDAALDRGRVHGQRGGIGVGEDGQGLVAQDRVIGGVERKRRTDHLIARIHAYHVQAGDQGRGAAGGGQAALCAEQLRISGLEFGHFSAAARPIPIAAAQYLEHFRLPRLAPFGPCGPAALVRRLPAEQGRLLRCRSGPSHHQSHTGRRSRGHESTSINCPVHLDASKVR